MPKISVSLEIGQIKEAISQLGPRTKIKLVKDLEKTMWPDRLRQLLAKIDQKTKERPVPDDEITTEVERVRKNHYDRSCN